MFSAFLPFKDLRSLNGDVHGNRQLEEESGYRAGCRGAAHTLEREGGAGRWQTGRLQAAQLGRFMHSLTHISRLSLGLGSTDHSGSSHPQWGERRSLKESWQQIHGRWGGACQLWTAASLLTLPTST